VWIITPAGVWSDVKLNEVSALRINSAKNFLPSVQRRADEPFSFSPIADTRLFQFASSIAIAKRGPYITGSQTALGDKQPANVVFMTVGDDHAFNLVSIFADTSCQAGRCSPVHIFGRKSQPGIQDDNFIVVLETQVFLPISYKPPRE